MDLILCLGCLELSATNEENKVYKCNKCGNEIEATKYDRIFNKTKESLELSYRYRLAYERVLLSEFGRIDFDEDEVELDINFFHPEVTKILTMIGMLAFSGIVGNYAFNFIELSRKKLLQLLKEAKLTEEEIQLLRDNEKFEEMIKYINDLSNNYDDLPGHLKEKLRKDKSMHDYHMKVYGGQELDMEKLLEDYKK